MSGLSLGDNQTGRWFPQMKRVGELSYTESLSDDDVFYNAEAENAPPDQGTNCPESTSQDEGVLEQKASFSEVSERSQTKAKPQMSDQPRDSSQHSRESRGKSSTKGLQNTPETEKEN